MVVVPQSYLQHQVCVLAQTRRRSSHLVLTGGEGDSRSHQTDPAHPGVINVLGQLAVLDLRVSEDLLHGVDRAVRKAGSLECLTPPHAPNLLSS